MNKLKPFLVTVSMWHILLALLIIFLLVLPLFSGKYILYMVQSMCIFCLLSLSVNLLLGYTGLLSFGQAGFYAVGAYACGKILMIIPSLPLGIIGGVIIAGITAVILGVFCIRNTRIYFAMLTLAFGMLIHAAALRWRSFTGGDDGLVGIPKAPLEIPHIFRVDMTLAENYYYFTLIISIIAIFILYKIIHSPLGLTFRSIRDSERRVEFSGISVMKHRILAFGIAGIYAGLGGALLAPLEQTVTPALAHWTASAEPIIATLLGGVQNFGGPIVGVVIFYLMKDIIVRFIGEYWMPVFGAIIIILVITLRVGVLGYLQMNLYPQMKLHFTKRGTSE